ncbi:MAG TPA: DUF4003 family protein [Planctomycetota bacterium]|nr:DUF4003 family protein [Planctomycetota bacterium]
MLRQDPTPTARGPQIPANPLGRFCAIYESLNENRSWWEGRTMFRFCALALTTLPGEPRELAARLDRITEDLRTSTPWYKRSSVGTMLAALLLRHDDGAKGSIAELERAGPLFREHWRFSGSSHEALAIQVLRQHSPDRRVSEAQVARLAEIWKEMKKHHPVLTQKTDWPICALLATTSATPVQIAVRLEAVYQDLRERGFHAGDQLQTAAQVLFFHHELPGVVAARFQELYEQFKSSGLWMGSADYDEIALLCFAPQPASEILSTVQGHREKIRALKPAPDKQTSFTLACGTALLELARGSKDTVLLSEAQLLIAIQAILAAQQAAVIASTAAAS